jgi:hypothetical protein
MGLEVVKFGRGCRHFRISVLVFWEGKGIFVVEFLDLVILWL